MEWAYKSEIIRRDWLCVLKDNENYPCYGPTDIHHIKTIASGGTDERINLISLCRHHHITLAHWTDQNIWQEAFERYTVKHPRPDNRDQIMIRSAEQRKQMKEAQRARDKKRRQSTKVSVSDLVQKIKEKYTKPEPTPAMLEYKMRQKQQARKQARERYLKQKAYKKEYENKRKVLNKTWNSL